METPSSETAVTALKAVVDFGETPVTDTPVVRYAHVPFTVDCKTGRFLRTRITFAYYTSGRDIVFGASFCNPVDNFSRAEGRERAFTRLTETPTTLTRSSSKQTDVLETIAAYIEFCCDFGISVPGLGTTWRMARSTTY